MTVFRPTFRQVLGQPSKTPFETLGVTGVLQPLRAVTNANIFAQNFTTVGLTRIKSRIGFTVGGGALSQIVPNLYNLRSDPSGFILNSNPFTINKLALEIGAAYAPVFFGGSRSRVVAAGAGDILGDAILPSAFSLANIPDGTRCYWRLEMDVPLAGNSFPAGIPYEGAGGGAFPEFVGFCYNPALNTDTSDIDGTGNLFLGTGPWSAVTRPFFPITLGRYVSGSPNVWLGVGDSIIAGLSDTLEGATYGYAGYFARALINSTFNGAYKSGINMGSSGTTHAMWTGSNNALARAYWAYCTAAVENYGTNNFAAGATLANVQTESQALWTAIRAAGISTILRQPILPRTNSTDNWQTAGANQTGVNAAFNAGGLVAQYNTWLATQIGGSGITALLDTSSVRDATNPEDWGVNGTPFYLTPDGVHNSAAASILLANALRTLQGSYP